MTHLPFGIHGSKFKAVTVKMKNLLPYPPLSYQK